MKLEEDVCHTAQQSNEIQVDSHQMDQSVLAPKDETGKVTSLMFIKLEDEQDVFPTSEQSNVTSQESCQAPVLIMKLDEIVCHTAQQSNEIQDDSHQMDLEMMDGQSVKLEESTASPKGQTGKIPYCFVCNH